MISGCSTFVFDLDGTLVTSDLDFPAMKAAVVRGLERRGVPPHDLASLDILAAVDHACRLLPHDADTVRREADEMLSEWEARGAEACQEIPGTLEFLNALRRRGFRIGIVTRNARASAETVLRRLPLPHDVLLTRHDVPHAKPHPAHLEHALRALDAAPGSSVMVGDHWMDILAGRRAGMRTAGVLGANEASRFEQAPPDLMVERVSDLSAYLEAPGLAQCG